MKYNVLNDKMIKTIETKEGKKIELCDGDRLYLHIYPSGVKTFFFVYKKKKIKLGKYPYLSLSQARGKANKLRTRIENGIDPLAETKAETKKDQENTFERVFNEWIETVHDSGSGHVKNIRLMFEKHLFPTFRVLPIKDLRSHELFCVLNNMEAISTSKRIRLYCELMLDWAMDKYQLPTNVAMSLKRRMRKYKKNNLAAATTPDEFRTVLHKIWDNTLQPKSIINFALCMAPHLPVRAGDLVAIKWVDLKLERREWHLTSSKTQEQMIIYLSDQVLALIDELHPITGKREYLFPHRDRPRTDHMTTGGILTSLRSAGVSQTESCTHGFRASFRTIMDESGYDREKLELCIGHTSQASHNGAYDRTKFLSDRREIMQAWSDKISSFLEKSS